MKIWHDEVRGKIYGRANWQARGTLETCKTIGGFAYDRRKQLATWPLTLGTCQRLRAAFKDLEVSDELYAWARAQKNLTTAPSSNGSLKNLPDRMVRKMQDRPYQITGVRTIAERPRLALTDEPGLGKTIQSLGGIMEAGTWDGRHLVIAPKTAIGPTWVRQIHEWTNGQVFAAVGSKAVKQQAIAQFLEAGQGPRLLLTNPETLRTKVDQWCPRCEDWLSVVKNLPTHVGLKGHKRVWMIREQEYPELFGLKWDTIIADECDRYLLGLRPQTGKMPQWGEGMVRLGTDRKLAMTGTPFHGKEINLFGILHWLDPRVFSSFWNFVDQYFDQIDNGFGIEITGLNPDALQPFYEMLDQYMLRRTREEVRPELPPQLHINHIIEMEPGQARQYRQFEELGWSRIESGVVRSMGTLSTVTRLQQLAFGQMMVRGEKIIPYASAKLDWLMGALAERGIRVQGPSTGEMKYVIVSQFTQFLNWIEEKLNHAGIETLKITGEVVGKPRDEAVTDFQSPGGPRVMLLNIAAGGVSIDLDAWCDEMFILDEDWLEDRMEQVRGRINNRSGRIAPRIYHYIRSAGTVEERMADNNLRQAMMQLGHLDGRRGVEIAAKLLGRDR